MDKKPTKRLVKSVLSSSFMGFTYGMEKGKENKHIGLVLP